jgi:ABC-type glycerol-3-phosphate transport system permease component
MATTTATQGTAFPKSRQAQSLRTRRRVRETLGKAAIYAVIIVGAVLVAFPFFWQVSTSLKSPADVFGWPPIWFPIPPHPDNYARVAEIVPLARYLGNSLLVTGLVIVGTLVSCVFPAYAFARLRFPGRDKIFLVLVSGLLIPPMATLVPQFIFFHRLGWYNTLFPLIVPAFFGNAFFIFLLRQFFLSISPDLEDAARIDGAGYLRVLWDVVLPLSKPALATVAIFTFVWTWNDFFSPLIYLSDDELYTMPLGLVFFQGGPQTPRQIHLLMAMAVVVVAPCIAIYFVAQRAFIQGIVFTGLKG